MLRCVRVCGCAGTVWRQVLQQDDPILAFYTVADREWSLLSYRIGRAVI